MAAVVPMASPVRQPFGNVGSSKLRNLANLKNRQNALSQPTQPGSLKRRAPMSDLSDSENTDPMLLKSATKRKRSDNDTLDKPEKHSSYTLMVKQTSKASSTFASIKPAIATPRSHHASSKSISLPAPTSASALAGRSPKKSNRVGILGRRRTVTNSTPFKRIDPPVFVRPNNDRNAGFSIASALGNTVSTSSSKAKVMTPIHTTIEESMPKSWMFDIYEESEDEMLGTEMQHSTQTLDISDDEDKIKEKNDRGKENIPPNDLLRSVTDMPVAAPRTSTSATSRKDMMTDEPRTPLGDLNAADYYAEGCDVSSVFVIRPEEEDHDASLDASLGAENKTNNDVDALPQPEAQAQASEPQATCPTEVDLYPFISSTLNIDQNILPLGIDSTMIGGSNNPLANNNMIINNDASALFEAETTKSEQDAAIADTNAEIEIWESGSAAGEDVGDRCPRDNIFSL